MEGNDCNEPAMIIFAGRKIARERICKISLVRASVNQYEIFRISISFAGSGHMNLGAGMMGK